MSLSRLRRQNQLNVFIVLTDLLFVTVFILLLQVLSQGLAARSKAEHWLLEQRKDVTEVIAALGKEQEAWPNVIRVFQHESLQRLCFTEAMTFRKGSDDIEQLPDERKYRSVRMSGRKKFLETLARELHAKLPKNATITIEGFQGPDEGEDLGVSRARKVMHIFREAGFPHHRLVASVHGAQIPAPYDYGPNEPDRDEASSNDRRVELLIICRGQEDK